MKNRSTGRPAARAGLRAPVHAHEAAAPAPPRASSVDFEELCEIVRRASGIKIDASKETLVHARLRQRLNETGARNVSGYLQMLRADATGRETAILLDLISTNVTSFFREQHHFDHLAKVALPAHQASGSPDPMRVWSAACSSGEEPYSIAMTLADRLGEDRLRRFLILATDISTRMVARSERASFASAALVPVRRDWRETWFEADGAEDRRVVWKLRDRVRSRHLNLLDPWPMKRSFSAIFCRNVLIYFAQPTCQRLVQRFWDQLAPGGYLYIGHSESLSQLSHGFEYAGPTIYRRPLEVKA